MPFPELTIPQNKINQTLSQAYLKIGVPHIMLHIPTPTSERNNNPNGTLLTLTTGKHNGNLTKNPPTIIMRGHSTHQNKNTTKIGALHQTQPQAGASPLHLTPHQDGTIPPCNQRFTTVVQSTRWTYNNPITLKRIQQTPRRITPLPLITTRKYKKHKHH